MSRVRDEDLQPGALIAVGGRLVEITNVARWPSHGAVPLAVRYVDGLDCGAGDSPTTVPAVMALLAELVRAAPAVPDYLPDVEQTIDRQMTDDSLSEAA